MSEEAAVESIREGLSSDDPETRRETIRSLFEGREEWTGLEPLIPDLIETLEDDSFVRESAAKAIGRIGTLSPDQAEALATRLDGGERATRYYAVDALHGVAENDPGAIEPAISALVEFLAVRDGLEGQTPDSWLAGGPVEEHDSPTTMRSHGMRRLRAVEALGRVAETDPDSLADEADGLVGIAGRPDHPEVRTDVLAILATVAEARPEPFKGEIEPIAAILDGGDGEGAGADASVRANAAFLLAILAEDRSTAVADAAASRGDAIAAMLDSVDDVATNAAIGLCAYVAEERPGTVEPMADSVLALLDHDLKSVRGNAVWTLAPLDGEGIDDRLAAVAEDDPSEEIRDHAAAVLGDRSAE